MLGVAQGPVLSARLASPGDELWLVVNRSGSFYRHYPFWDAATKANPGLLRSHLSLLPALAADGIVHAAKDISMGGLCGTAVMFAESCGASITLELDASSDLRRWRSRPGSAAFPASDFCWRSIAR